MRSHRSTRARCSDAPAGGGKDFMLGAKVAPPFRQAEFDILYDQGISVEGDLLDLGVDAGIVEKSGAWYSYEDQRIGQGRENARKFLKENLDVRERIAEAVYLSNGLKRPVPAKGELAGVAEGPVDKSADKSADVGGSA